MFESPATGCPTMEVPTVSSASQQSSMPLPRPSASVLSSPERQSLAASCADMKLQETRLLELERTFFLLTESRRQMAYMWNEGTSEQVRVVRHQSFISEVPESLDMDWDLAKLECLDISPRREPHASGMGDNRYADEVKVQPADHQGFQELADRWEAETVLLSDSDRAAQHPTHQEIVNMGKAAVPLILERIRSQGGLWFHALSAITGADPVAPKDHGNVAAMQESWLKWGERNGYM